MDRVAVRALFDKTMRVDPPARVGVERTWSDGVFRTAGVFTFISWWDFTSDQAAEIVAREAAYARAIGHDLEWQVYDHDGPEGLERALVDAGFEDPGVETCVALETAAAARLATPSGVAVREVRSEAEIADYVAVLLRVFGDGEGITPEFYLQRMHDPSMALFLAYVDGRPAAAGRLELPAERPFAGLWDGAVAPEHRGAGLYRSLVAIRAQEAAVRGARYVYVDARETSRPILERLGFERLATMRGWLLRATPPIEAPRALFICKGNWFRSQTAAAIYNKLTAPDRAHSAGTYVGAADEPEGQVLADLFPTPDFFEAMERRGMYVRANTTRRLQPEMLAGYDLVVSMAEDPYVPNFLRTAPGVTWWDVENPRVVDRAKAEEMVQLIDGLVRKLLAAPMHEPT